MIRVIHLPNIGLIEEETGIPSKLKGTFYRGIFLISHELEDSSTKIRFIEKKVFEWKKKGNTEDVEGPLARVSRKILLG